MPSVKERFTGWVTEVRKRRPFVDHLVRMQEHYGKVQASQQAGAVTYFAFLSIFPILAIGFWVVGYLVSVFPHAQTTLVTAVNDMLPHMIKTPDSKGQIKVSEIENAASAAGLIGVVGLLYAGLGWLSAMRDALVVVFEEPRQEQPNFVIGKLRDLASLSSIGFILLFSVGLAGLVSGWSDDVLHFFGITADISWVVESIGRLFSFLANILLFFTLFKLLARPVTPRRSLWSGALLGAIAFEVLKVLSFLFLGTTQGSPAFQVFGFALVMLVWINYTSRGTLYAAAWAHTSIEAREIRDREALERARMQQLTRVDLHEAAAPGPRSRASAVRSFAAGGATALAVVAALRKKKEEDS